MLSVSLQTSGSLFTGKTAPVQMQKALSASVHSLINSNPIESEGYPWIDPILDPKKTAARLDDTWDLDGISAAKSFRLWDRKTFFLNTAKRSCS